MYDGSAGVFRKRWDFLLSQLGVDSSLHVTPGGLRGGGAVECYRKGMHIADLVWRMRLKQISTLESYLQEVAAMSLLTDLTPQSRRSMKSASSLFEFFGRTLTLGFCDNVLCTSYSCGCSPLHPALLFKVDEAELVASPLHSSFAWLRPLVYEPYEQLLQFFAWWCCHLDLNLAGCSKKVARPSSLSS